MIRESLSNTATVSSKPARAGFFPAISTKVGQHLRMVSVSPVFFPNIIVAAVASVKYSSLYGVKQKSNKSISTSMKRPTLYTDRWEQGF